MKNRLIFIFMGAFVGLFLQLFLVMLDLQELDLSFTLSNLLDIINSQRLHKVGLFVFPFIWSLLGYLFSLNREHLNKVKVLSNERRDLLRLVIHDISNPLGASMGALELFKKKNVTDEDRVKYLNFVDVGLKAVESIITRLRLMQSIDSGKEEVALEPVSLDSALENIQTIFRRKLEEKHIRLIFEKENCETPYCLANSSILIHQVFSNILSNAIKFTSQDGRILIKMICDEEYISVIFQDFGVGMDSELLENIFHPTKKTTRRGTGNELGTGFGMPLVKRYIDKFNAKIEIESQSIEKHPNEHGTKITIHLLKTSL